MPLERVSDVHSICLIGDSIVVVSTGTDEIVSFDRRSMRSQVLWRASPAQDDKHHLNSTARHKGKLLCTAFGEKGGARWYTAQSGYVAEIDTGRHLVQNIYHPHSLTSFRSELYYCESSRSRVLTANYEVFKCSGYMRGLTFDDGGNLYAGCSIGRKSNEAPQGVLNPADPSYPHGRCEVHLVPYNGKEPHQTLDLSAHGNEIYDIAVISEVPKQRDVTHAAITPILC